MELARDVGNASLNTEQLQRSLEELSLQIRQQDQVTSRHEKHNSVIWDNLLAKLSPLTHVTRRKKALIADALLSAVELEDGLIRIRWRV